MASSSIFNDVRAKAASWKYRKNLFLVYMIYINTIYLCNQNLRIIHGNKDPCYNFLDMLRKFDCITDP